MTRGPSVTVEVIPSGQACGAIVRGVDLTDLDHKVLGFPEQTLTDDHLEAFTLHFGPFGDDPFFAPIEGHRNIAAISRRADETAPLFAENWHTDWSFQEYPPDGTYGDDDSEDRSMQIVPSETAYATQTHPIIRTHPETGAETLYSVLGYIIGFEGMVPDESRSLLGELYRWQVREEFQYRHRWEPNMLTMWDNRCVLHRATGGYDGYDRLLHRTTIGFSGAGLNTPG